MTETHERTAQLIKERRRQLVRGFEEALNDAVSALERDEPLPFTVSGQLALTEIGFTFQIGSNPLCEDTKDEVTS